MFSSGKKIPREQKEPGLFDEAQSILFKELLPYWAGFCKQYTQPEDVNKVKLPRKYCPFVQRSSVRAFKARGGYSPVADPDLQIRVGEGDGHPDPELRRWGGGRSPKKFFSAHPSGLSLV